MINQEALDLIVEFEGFVPNWYKDPVGIWTVCYGHTDAAGSPLYKDTKGKKFSISEGRAILAKDLESYEAAVRRQFKGVVLNENQFGALVSFCYNLGEGNLSKSTLRRKILNKDVLGAADEFLKWNKAGGKTLPGLVRRRKAERALFLKPVSQTSKDTNLPINPGSHSTAPQESQGPQKNILVLILEILRKIFA